VDGDAGYKSVGTAAKQFPKAFLRCADGRTEEQNSGSATKEGKKSDPEAGDSKTGTGN
jgi:hypothetical protein